MIYHPNRVSIAPTDGAYDGDTWADRAVAHPGLLCVPRLVEALPAGHPGSEAPFNAPPQPVVDAVYTYRWAVTAELFGAGLSLSIADTMEGAITTISGALRSGTSASKEWGEGEAPDNWIKCMIGVGTSNLWFDWSAGKWWPALTVIAQCRQFGESGGFGGARLGTTLLDPAEAGVQVAFCGHDFPTFDPEDIPLTGTITIKPEAYLEVI